ncbi:MAG: T9SS type A sorting domain-containing protein [Bacteroidota bacterium]
MKSLLFVMLLCCSSMGYTQGTYPRGVGNRWEYGAFTGSGKLAFEYSTEITGDTIMSDGAQYAVLQSSNAGDTYLRQAGYHVYEYISPGTELMICNFDLSYRWGDTVNIQYLPNDTLITTVNNHRGVVFGRYGWIWSFQTYSPRTKYYRTITVADSIGCIQIDESGQPTFYLNSAVINGKRYGTPLTGVKNSFRLPQTFTLFQNYPNPFNPATMIQYDLSERNFVNLTIWNILGEKIQTLVNAETNPGDYTVAFDASRFPSGTYLYTLRVGDLINQKKMLLIR